MIKRHGFIHQTVIVILASMIRISYLSKLGKFGRCQTGKVSFTKELVIAISSQTQTKKENKKEKKKKERVIAILESMIWISNISKFGKCYYISIIA